MRAKIYTDGSPSCVTVIEDNPRAEWDDQAPATITTTYFCPDKGGYVRIHKEDGNHQQVCEGLAGMGSTLHCSNPDKLIELIRKERRRGIAATRRYLKG